jgi:hypothetical protein
MSELSSFGHGEKHPGTGKILEIRAPSAKKHGPRSPDVPGMLGSVDNPLDVKILRLFCGPS